MGLFERYLSIWVGLCIASGVVLGNVLPAVFQAIAQIEYAHVNLGGQVTLLAPPNVSLTSLCNCM